MKKRPAKPQGIRVPVHVWTDGSCSAKDRVGGWAFIAAWHETEVVGKGGLRDTTISVMELTAINEALKRVKPVPGVALVVHSDSQYAVNCLTTWGRKWRVRGWTTATGEEVKNKELIAETLGRIDTYLHRSRATVTIKWVKGHAGNANNERADVYAGDERRRLLSNPDEV